MKPSLLLLPSLVLLAAPLRAADDGEYKRMKVDRELVEKAVSKYPDRDRAYYRRRWIEEFDAAGKALFDAQRDVAEIQKLRADYQARYEKRVERFGFNKVYDQKVVIPYRNKTFARLKEAEGRSSLLLKLRLRMLENDPVYLPPLKPDDWTVGRVGTIEAVKILEIIDSGTLKVALTDLSRRPKTGKVFILANVPTDRVKVRDVVPTGEEWVRVVGEKDGLFTLRVLDGRVNPLLKDRSPFTGP